MKRIEFGEDMNEVSGLGGFYERCCRAAIVAGADCIAHKVFDTQSIEYAMRLAHVTTDDGRKVPLESELTPGQFGLAMYHVQYITHHGWDAYRRQMTTPLKIYDAHGALR